MTQEEDRFCFFVLLAFSEPYDKYIFSTASCRGDRSDLKVSEMRWGDFRNFLSKNKSPVDTPGTDTNPSSSI